MAGRGGLWCLLTNMQATVAEPPLFRLCRTVTDSALQGALAAAYHSKGWQRVGAHQNTEIWHLKDSTDYHKFRRTAHISAPPKRVLDFLLNPANAKHWNETLEESRLLREVGQWQILYQRTSLPWPLKPRDYLLVASGSEIKGGTAYVMSSIELPEAPHRSEVVRAHIDYSAVISLDDHHGGSKVTYVSSVKLNGDLPHRVVYSLIKSRNSAIERIREMLDEW